MRLTSRRAGLPALGIARIGLPTLLLAVLLTLAGAPRASAADTNTIMSIKNAASDSVDITLTSSREFGMRDDILTLQIGPITTSLSRFPAADGNTGTVTFTLTAAQFAVTTTGNPVIVYYGSNAPTDAEAWQFGKLDKTMLK